MSVFDADVPPSFAPPAGANSKVELVVRWGGGAGGGLLSVDAQHGSIIHVGAATAVSVDAAFMSRDGASLVIGFPKVVRITAKWNTSGRQGEPAVTLPQVTINPDLGVSPFLRLPRGAKNLTALANSAAAYATLVGELYASVTGAIVYETRFGPVDERIVGDVEFVRFRGPGGVRVLPTFGLWC